MELIVLTRSAKNEGLCVAGLDANNEQFVRLVTNDEKTHYAVPRSKMNRINTLDVIDVPIIGYNPSFCQIENYIADVSKPWDIVGHIDIHDLIPRIDNDSHQWLFGNQSYYLLEEEAQQMTYSLTLIKVNDLNLETNTYGKTKAHFEYNGKRYTNMAVTDWDYFGLEEEISEALIVVSIPDIGKESQYYEGKRCYKLVSRIFTL